MKKIVMSAIAALFLAGTSFAGVTPKVTKTPVKQEKKTEKKKTVKVNKTNKKKESDSGKAVTKPKVEVKK